MSEMGFGYYSDQSGEVQPQGLGEQPPAGAEPKWFRDYMAKASEQNKAMATELQQLRAESRHNKVADTLRSKGYDPAVASLYGGEPDKVDDWLSTHGALLAQRPDAPQGVQDGEQAPTGPPASSVPPEVQDQMRRMQSAGAGATAPQDSEAELVARLRSANSKDELADIFRAQGSSYDFTGF